jgi:hypothetical protein
MKTTIVRYKTKDAASGDENERLIKDVFLELARTAPDGLHYLVARLGDGSFIHFAVLDDAAMANPLFKLEAFRAFQGGVAGRCVEQPQSAAAAVVGSYRIFP